MNAFMEFASRMMPFSPDSMAALEGILQRKALPKGTVLVTEGAVCDHVYYIEQGLSRTYYHKEGKDVTDWISTEGTFACSIVSFITGRPDRRGIVLLEDSVLWGIHRTALQRLYQYHHEIERFGRLLTETGLLQVQQRFDDLHFATAAERYAHLMSVHPTVIQRVPLGMVASYLGMTPETLSRIRAAYGAARF